MQEDMGPRRFSEELVSLVRTVTRPMALRLDYGSRLNLSHRLMQRTVLTDEEVASDRDIDSKAGR
jgi:hypothetical protein